MNIITMVVKPGNVVGRCRLMQANRPVEMDDRDNVTTDNFNSLLIDDQISDDSDEFIRKF